MKSKIIVITGASDGIGAAAARELKKLGHTVVIIGRSPEKTRAIATELKADYYVTDFAVLDEVRQLADKLRTKYPRIDVLANNAGGVFGDRRLTVDGHEKTFQVNHLAHFLLTTLLIDVLASSKATVINTSSAANKLFSNFDINDLDLSHGYTANRAYGNAKLANILFTQELHPRYAETGINAVSFHPGTVATSFASDSTSFLRFIYKTPLKKLLLTSPAKGADTLIWLATGVPGTDWTPGQYYVSRKESSAIAAAAQDPTISLSLWEQSERFVSKNTVS